MRRNEQAGLTALEKRSAAGLVAVYGVRMLGLFLILPVFALYAQGLEGVTPTLIGIAIGIYGLTQALLQIPLGMLSDHVGRKPVILGGLAVFALGSVVAAMSDSITGVIIGRAMQGSGAIAAATMALLADLTRDSIRTRVMAMVGMSIGIAFMLAMVGGPVLNHWIGVDGIFWLTAVLAGLAAVIVIKVIPTPSSLRMHRDAETVSSDLGRVLSNPQLVRLDFGIFTLHLMLTASWVVIPVQLVEQFGFASTQHWKLYLPVMVLSVLAMVPFIIYAEKYRRMKPVFVGAVAVLVIAELLMTVSVGALAGLALALWVFFSAFNLLEASLPSLIAKTAPPELKGTAMGVYSTAQFLGIFVGGFAGGWIYEHHGIVEVFIFCTLIALVWLIAAMTMATPQYLSSYSLDVGDQDSAAASALVQELMAIKGVVEAVVIAEEGMAYLKVDHGDLDTAALQQYSKN